MVGVEAAPFSSPKKALQGGGGATGGGSHHPLLKSRTNRHSLCYPLFIGWRTERREAGAKNRIGVGKRETVPWTHIEGEL